MTEERPSKRIRLEDSGSLTSAAQQLVEPSKDQQEEEIQLQKELNAGITCYVSPNTPGFSGILKQRLVLSDSSLAINAQTRPYLDIQTFWSMKSFLPGKYYTFNTYHSL
jgi:hypothetical protein